MACRQLQWLLVHSTRALSCCASSPRLTSLPTLPRVSSCLRRFSVVSGKVTRAAAEEERTEPAAAGANTVEEQQEAADEKPKRVRRKAASTSASGVRRRSAASAVFSPPAVEVEVEEAADGRKTRRTSRGSRKDRRQDVVVEATTSPQSAASVQPPPRPPTAASSPDSFLSHTRAAPTSSSRQRNLFARQPSPGFSPFASSPAAAVASSPSSFGIQHVLSLLYSYLPTPPSSPPSPSPPAESSSLPTAPALPPPVSVYDVSSRSIFSDFLVVVQTHSARQMRFLAFALYRAARDADACSRNRSTLSIERRNAEDWTLVDIGHCIVHLFNSQAPLPKPGLDFHPSHLLALGDDDRQQEAATEAGAVHPVIRNIVKQFGDLLVPPSAHAQLRDIGHEDGSRRGAGKGDGVRLVQDVRNGTAT
jgi:hypothetical protein